ncbi:hypothetical protein C9374_009189 [Naegleria lovaniensis]|uniref:Phosphatidylinositol-specific phospholipase C X domain-containing protein n=1 Tax=Naegleria lovaniensis TaxID=51637 RepID=A0AA88GFP1_NAELO|nr:uncharacterized protein C9374_009189 [Naegleria lovaniensis]KAG2377673.1 hypothetical protein C9374_009189 [Naegleria lovaniensis]
MSSSRQHFQDNTNVKCSNRIIFLWIILFFITLSTTCWIVFIYSFRTNHSQTSWKQLAMEWIEPYFISSTPSPLFSKILQRDKHIHERLKQKFYSRRQFLNHFSQDDSSTSREGPSSLIPTSTHSTGASMDISSTTSSRPWYLKQSIIQVLSQKNLSSLCECVNSTSTARWMAEHYEQLKNKTLNQVLLPGTHDSLTYDINFYNNRSALMFSNDIDSMLLKLFNLPFVSKPFMYMIMVPWANTQSCHVTQQLMHGIRYFDIRICKDEREPLVQNRFKSCHNYFGSYISEVLEQVVDFLTNVSPYEFLVLDFNHFYGMDADDHEFFANYIATTLNHLLVQPSQFEMQTKLENLWKTSKRIYAFYSENVIPKSVTGYLWNSSNIDYAWADTTSMDYLNEYNIAVLVERQQVMHHFLNLQLVLTPGMIDFVNGFTKRPYSVLDLSYMVAQQLPKWISQDYNSTLLNVITCDFYHLFNFTEVVIARNFQN